MKYLTLSILFQFTKGKVYRLANQYTYTLTPIIKLSYFLFNQYKTTIALPWLSSALLFLHSRALYCRAYFSLPLLPFCLFLVSPNIFPFSSNPLSPLTHYNRPTRIVATMSSTLLIIFATNCVVSQFTTELRASRTLEQYTRNYRCNLLIQDLAHHQGKQAGLVLQEKSPVVRMPGKVE